jgi:hypothetical protein
MAPGPSKSSGGDTPPAGGGDGGAPASPSKGKKALSKGAQYTAKAGLGAAGIFAIFTFLPDLIKKLFEEFMKIPGEMCKSAGWDEKICKIGSCVISICICCSMCGIMVYSIVR